jgi:phosphatidate cytidylyltransferase
MSAPEPLETTATVPEPKAKKGLGNLASRALVALVAIPILLLLIYQEIHHAILWAPVYLASLIAMHELFALTMDDADSRRAALVIGAAVTAGFYWLPADTQPVLVALVASFVLPALYYLFRFGDMSTVAARLAATTTGIVYGGILLTFLALIKRLPHGPDLIILVLASAWLSDTGGYFAGKSMGRHKLYPAVSPNKTWEGSIGGVLAAAAGAAVIKVLLLPEIGWLHIMMLAVPGAILGQIGDLAESLIKRSVGVKDSGALLPGHGGILDRVDAILFIAPYVFLYVVIVLS